MSTGTLVDDTTAVWWLQTPCGMYVDVRIPKSARPGGVPSPADLATQKSFAGYLTAEGDVTTWHRHIDFRPSTGACRAMAVLRARPPRVCVCVWIRLPRAAVLCGYPLCAMTL